MVGVFCLIAVGIFDFYKASQSKKQGNDKQARFFRGFGAISITIGIVLGIAIAAMSL